jgi:hypothetical protein
VQKKSLVEGKQALKFKFFLHSQVLIAISHIGRIENVERKERSSELTKKNSINFYRECAEKSEFDTSTQPFYSEWDVKKKRYKMQIFMRLLSDEITLNEHFVERI